MVDGLKYNVKDLIGFQWRRITTSKAIEEKNKALVLEAFDTLFNHRDYVSAERYWSPNYIQHSAHIAPGREGLFNLIKSIPPTSIFLTTPAKKTARTPRPTSPTTTS